MKILNEKSSFSLIITDRFFRRHTILILASAIIPLVFQLIHMLGFINFSPFGFLLQVGKQNFLFLSIIFICVGFPILEIVGSLVIGLIIALAWGGNFSQDGAINVFSYSGLCFFFLLIMHCFKGSRNKALASLIGWLPFLFTTMTAPAALSLGSKIFSNWTYDGVFFFVEKKLLGGTTAFQAFLPLEHAHPWIGHLMRSVYDSLNLVGASIIGFAIRYNYKRTSIPLFFIVSGVIAGFVYGVIPVISPIATLQQFGENIPLSRLNMGGVYAKNGMPSLHMGWALSIAIFSYEMPNIFLKIFYTLFFVLTALATMAIGEHYMIDLIVAVPFILSIMTLLKVDQNIDQRDSDFKIYLLLVLVWYAAILSSLFPRLPVSITWAMFFATLILCTIKKAREIKFHLKCS